MKGFLDGLLALGGPATFRRLWLDYWTSPPRHMGFLTPIGKAVWEGTKNGVIEEREKPSPSLLSSNNFSLQTYPYLTSSGQRKHA